MQIAIAFTFCSSPFAPYFHRTGIRIGSTRLRTAVNRHIDLGKVMHLLHILGDAAVVGGSHKLGAGAQQLLERLDAAGTGHTTALTRHALENILLHLAGVHNHQEFLAFFRAIALHACLLYTSDAADD